MNASQKQEITRKEVPFGKLVVGKNEIESRSDAKSSSIQQRQPADTIIVAKEVKTREEKPLIKLEENPLPIVDYSEIAKSFTIDKSNINEKIKSSITLNEREIRSELSIEEQNNNLFLGMCYKIRRFWWKKYEVRLKFKFTDAVQL